MKINKAINIIERANSYYLLSNDKVSIPVLVGGRVKLEYCLEGITEEMIIATSGNDKRCVVLVDYTGEEVLHIAQRANERLLKLKSLN